MKLLFMLSLLQFIYCIQIPKTVDHDTSLNRLEIDNYPFHIKKVGLSSRNAKEKIGIEQDIEDLHKIILNFSENKKQNFSSFTQS